MGNVVREPIVRDFETDMSGEHILLPDYKACRGCGAADVTTFLDLGWTPVANTYRLDPDDRETSYPLQLGRCAVCGLVQQGVIVPDSVIYGPQYGFYSGGSAPQRRYHAETAMQLQQLVPSFDDLVVEIACNDGSLLAELTRMGYTNLLGVDPSAPVRTAVERSIRAWEAKFTAELATQIRAGFGPAKLVIAQHVLAHVEDLGDMLTGIWELMDEDSTAAVDVQYLPDLLAGNMYDQVYHEHRYFWSLRTWIHLAKLRGLYVVDAELINFQNGSLRVYLTRKPRLPSTRAGRILRGEAWADEWNAYASMQGRVARVRERLVRMVRDEIAAGHTVAGYAASAKATTILNSCGLTVNEIPYIIDSTPQKQGRFLPGTRIPIVGDDKDLIAAQSDLDRHESQPTYLLLASNYLGAVLRDRCEFLSSGGRWIVPVPNPMVI